MIAFEAEIKKYGNHGDKTGWSYVEVPQEQAAQLKPGHARSFRVRGTLDGTAVAGVALVPVGGGDFILPVNGAMRRQLGKSEGNRLVLALEEDTDFKIDLPPEMEVVLQQNGEGLFERFMALAPSHRTYFIKYFNEAKTEATQAKRLAMTVEAMELGLDYGAMIRLSQSRKREERGR